jgi:NADH:ubiquinone oxidoreductase subunit C
VAESPAQDRGQAPEEVGVEELAGEPEGPDLSSLGPDARLWLDAALEVLEPYDPQPGTLGDLPQLTVDRCHIADVCRVMKDDERIGAKMLLCLAAVDYPPAGSSPRAGHRAPPPLAEEESQQEEDPGGRMQVVYFLQSLEPERTLVLKTEAPYDDPVVPSVAAIWRAADWYEREAHDLFGLSFEGHPDLAPLLLYDDFEGYPGRKEFPFYEYREF